LLPLYVRDPVEMLHAVATRMEIMKSVGAAELLAIFASCLGATPAPMQELFWRGLPLVPLPLPLLNLICTNVPGSPSTLYTAGRRLVASYPAVPTGYDLGVGVAVQSYDGKLFFGLTADAHVVPDVALLRDYIRISFDELAKAAGAKGKPQRRARHRPGKRTEAGASVESAVALAGERLAGESAGPTNGHTSALQSGTDASVGQHAGPGDISTSADGPQPMPDQSRDRQGALLQPVLV